MKIPHGFTWFNALCLVLLIGLVFAIRWGFIIAPQVRATAAQVADLNNLPNVDCTITVKGCMMFSPTIKIHCEKAK